MMTFPQDKETEKLSCYLNQSLCMHLMCSPMISDSSIQSLHKNFASPIKTKEVSKNVECNQ